MHLEGVCTAVVSLCFFHPCVVFVKKLHQMPADHVHIHIVWCCAALCNYQTSIFKTSSNNTSIPLEKNTIMLFSICSFSLPHYCLHEYVFFLYFSSLKIDVIILIISDEKDDNQADYSVLYAAAM